MDEGLGLDCEGCQVLTFDITEPMDHAKAQVAASSSDGNKGRSSFYYFAALSESQRSITQRTRGKERLFPKGTG